MVTKDFSGVCAASVTFTIDEAGLVRDVSFVKGCNGNLQAVSRLVEGRSAQEAASLLSGITCGTKDTSCPAQFSLALNEELMQGRFRGESSP